MKIKFVLILIILVSAISVAADQQKRGQTGFKFLNVATDPRMVAMGEAGTAIEGSSSSMFFNPASMAWMKTMVDGQVGQVQWFADINYQYGAIAFAPSNGDFGVVGFSMQYADYGEITRTIRTDLGEGYLDLGTFHPIALQAGLSYARALSDRFAVGGNVKYTLQDLGNGVNGLNAQDNPLASKNSTDVVAFDFGMYYKTGLKSLNFAVSVRNFSQEVKYEREGFQLPLIFRVGVAFNAMDLITEDKDADAFLISIDATHPRDFSEQVNIGGEYTFIKIFALRAGYMFNNDLYNFTAGAGVHHSIEGVDFGVDYSYTPYDKLGTVNRFSVQFNF
ncbi:MAG: PorV/PorQ family protein [Bacteroidota bacterium]|nr:PorV/PorQ family protein [Bacteroidota bacterium]